MPVWLLGGPFSGTDFPKWPFLVPIRRDGWDGLNRNLYRLKRDLLGSKTFLIHRAIGEVPFFAISRHLSRGPGVQGSRGPKMAILWLEQDQNGWAASGWTGPFGKCLVRHITPQCMGEHDLGPLLPFPGVQASENAYFIAKTIPKWLGWHQAAYHTLKVTVQCPQYSQVAV